MQNIRLLNVNMGQYITELSNLKEAIKLEARELVDMNAQRYDKFLNLLELLLLKLLFLS